MFPLAALLALTLLTLLFYVHVFQRWSELHRKVEKTFPGPKPLPFIGNSHIFGTPEGAHATMMSLSNTYSRFFRIFIGSTVFIVLYTHRDFESVLSSGINLDKGLVYQFLYPWVGTGLLTADGNKWKSRRRIITPAFHFRILDSYIDFFNANGAILCKKLSQMVGKGPFDIHRMIKLYALDNICETAMKVKVNAQTNEESDYVKAIKVLGSTVVLRSFSVLYYSDLIFNVTEQGRRNREALKVVHDTTKAIIRERRKDFVKEKDKPSLAKQEDDEIGHKKQMAFLDILLSTSEGYALSDDDICEEVNTFLFEGHDTISSGISFALYCLAKNPHIQELAYEEQASIFGDSDRDPTTTDLQEMKYLDMVLKESQRIYPSVPLIGRKVNEDLKLSDGSVVPKGSQITLYIYRLHRDPQVWPDPETFNPDNFLPDAVAKRNPFAYVPFSAGSRNCIGQRFAINEMKCCVSKVLRNFKVKPCSDPQDDIDVYSELVLVSKTGVKLQVEPRN